MCSLWLMEFVILSTPIVMGYTYKTHHEPFSDVSSEVVSICFQLNWASVWSDFPQSMFGTEQLNQNAQRSQPSTGCKHISKQVIEMWSVECRLIKTFTHCFLLLSQQSISHKYLSAYLHPRCLLSTEVPDIFSVKAHPARLLVATVLQQTSAVLK